MDEDMDEEADDGNADASTRSRFGSVQDAGFLEELWQWAISTMCEPNGGVPEGAALCMPWPPSPPVAAPPYTLPQRQHAATISTASHAQPCASHTPSHTTHSQRPRFVVRQTDANPLGGFLEVASPVPQRALQLEGIVDVGESTGASCFSRGEATQFAAADAERAYSTDSRQGQPVMPTLAALSRSASTMSPTPWPEESPAFRRAISAPQTPSHACVMKANASSDRANVRTRPGLQSHVKEMFVSSASPVDGMSVCEGVVQGGRAAVRIPPSTGSMLGCPVDGGERSIEQMYASLDDAGKREYRRHSLERWLQERRHRSSGTRLMYRRRSLLASQRMRVGGRFVRQSVGFVPVTELQKSKPRSVGDGDVVHTHGLSGSRVDCTYPITSDESDVEVEDEKNGCSARDAE